MKEVERVTRVEKVDKKEVVLELDFHADDQGLAPALQDPPKFKVGLTRLYLQGKEEPDWFWKGTDVYENNITNFRTGLQDHYNRMTSDHLLTISRYSDGNFGVYRALLVSEDTGKPLFCDEALDAFRRAIIDSDDSRLGQIYGDAQRKYIQARRNAEARGDRLRQIMNEEGGEEFMAGMESLSRGLSELMRSDRYRELEREMQGDDGGLDNDGDFAWRS